MQRLLGYKVKNPCRGNVVGHDELCPHHQCLKGRTGLVLVSYSRITSLTVNSEKN